MLNNLSPVGVLDLGSYETKFIIFKITNSKIEILSKIILKTQGIKKGFISDIEKLANLINELIGKAEEIANLQINKVYLTISPINNFVISFCNSKNIIGYKIDHQKDVQFLINDSVNLFKDTYADCEIMHLFNYNFKIDKVYFVDDPVNLVADSFESEMGIILTKKNIIKNFINLIYSANIKLEKFIYSPYVLSLLVYSDSPLSEASIAIDFGHEKTSVSIFKNQNLSFATTIPIGSWHITNDISKSLNLNMNIAENLKINHSSCIDSNENQMHEFVESENFGSKSYKKVSNNILNKIVKSRVEEIIHFINADLTYFANSKQYFNKIVITGEGAKIRGFNELLQKKLSIKSSIIEKFTSKLKINLDDRYDLCLAMINYIQNYYYKEIPSHFSHKKNFFRKLYSLFN